MHVHPLLPKNRERLDEDTRRKLGKLLFFVEEKSVRLKEKDVLLQHSWTELHVGRH